MDSATRASERLRRLHVSSAVVLLIFLTVHLWEVAAAPFGRAALVARMSWHDGSSTPPLVILFVVLLPMLVHIFSGAALARAAQPAAPSGYPSHGSRKLQWVSGLFLLVFVGVHLADTWWFELVHHADAGQMHDRLRSRVGVPLILVVYVVAVGALVLHVTQGLMAMVARRVESGSINERSRRLLGGLFVVVAALVFVLLVNTVGYFAAGRGPIIDPSPAAADSVD